MGGKRLTEVEIADLRGKWAELPEEERTGAKQTELAADFGVSQTTIAKILKAGDKSAAKKTGKRGGRKKANASREAADPKPAKFTLRGVIREIVSEEIAAAYGDLNRKLPGIVKTELAELLKE